MRLIAAFLLAFALGPLATPARADDALTIAAAADLRHAMPQLVAAFKGSHPHADVRVAYGASGQLLVQVEQGAPFDLFFSADSDYPRQLAAHGGAGAAPVPYAIGHLVLWSRTLELKGVGVADLAQPRFARIALANPRHAPYGARAEQALREAGVLQAVRPRLLVAENVGQAATYARTGNATVGMIALSQALDPAFAGGHYVRVPDRLYAPLQQSFVLTAHGRDDALARAFAQFMQGPAAHAILRRFGFDPPGS